MLKYFYLGHAQKSNFWKMGGYHVMVWRHQVDVINVGTEALFTQLGNA